MDKLIQGVCLFERWPTHTITQMYEISTSTSFYNEAVVQMLVCSYHMTLKDVEVL